MQKELDIFHHFCSYDFFLKEAIPGNSRPTWQLFNLNGIMFFDDICWLNGRTKHLATPTKPFKCANLAISYQFMSVGYLLKNSWPWYKLLHLLPNISEASRTELHQSRGQSLRVGDGARMDSESKNQGFVNPLARLYMIHLHMYKTPIITLGPCLFDLNQIHEVRCWEWSSDFILFNRLITVSILDQGTQLGLLDFCLVERKVPDRSCGFAKKMVQKWVSHRSLIQRPKKTCCDATMN